MQPSWFYNLSRKVYDMQKTIFCSKNDMIRFQIRCGDFFLLEDVLQSALDKNEFYRVILILQAKSTFRITLYLNSLVL